MRKIILFILAGCCMFGPAFAARKRKTVKSSTPAESKSTAKVSDSAAPAKPKLSQSLQAWLKDMKKRVSKTNSKPNQIVAVAAVRGDETPDAPPLYWKGKKAEGKVENSELKDFESAIDTAMNGDSAAAKEKLNAFLSAYPKSSMTGDVNETLARLAESPAP